MLTAKIVSVSVAALLLAGCNNQQPGHNSAATAQANGVEPAEAEELLRVKTQRIHLVWKQADNKWKVKLNSDPTEHDPDKAATTLIKDEGPAMFIIDITTNKPSAPKFENPGGLTFWEGNITDPKSAPPSNPASTQILGPILTKNDKLVFWDVNQGNAVRVFYSINLTDGTSIDPIIDNGGGTWSP